MVWIDFFKSILGCKEKELTTQLEECKNQLPIVNPKEQYYNNKYPFQDIKYQRTDKFGTLDIDVRQFINPNNFLYLTYVPETQSEDELVLECLKWVIDNITYTPDATVYKQGEYWAFGYETYSSRKGDCEDGAILLADLLLHNNIPSWKIRVSAGWVINPYTKVKEGHCYLTYYCEESDKWVVLDWCYLPNKLKIKDRKDYKEEELYKEVWFSFNDKYSWSAGLNTSAKRMLKS